MWWAIGISIGLSSVLGGMWLWTAKNGRDLAQRLGNEKGENDALKAMLVEKIREIDGLRIALARALDPPPTLDELDRVSREASGDAAPSDADSAIRVP